MKKFTKKLTFVVVMVLTLALFFSVFVACNNNTNPDADKDPGTTVTPGGDDNSGDNNGDDDGQTPVTPDEGGDQTPGGDDNSGDNNGDDDGQTPVTPDEGGDQTPGGDDQGTVTPGGDENPSGGDDENPSGGDENPGGSTTPAFAFPEGAQKTWYTSEGYAIVVSASTLTYDGEAAIESGYYTSTNATKTVTYYHFSVGMTNTPYAIYTDGTDWYLAEVNRGNVLVNWAEKLALTAPTGGGEEGPTEGGDGEDEGGSTVTIPGALTGTWLDGKGIKIIITETSVDLGTGTELTFANGDITLTQDDKGIYTITEAYDEIFTLTQNSDGTLAYAYTEYDEEWNPTNHSATLKKAENFTVTVKDLSGNYLSDVTVTIGGVSATTNSEGEATLFTIPGAISLSGYDTKYTYDTVQTAVSGDYSYYITLTENITNTFYVKVDSTGLSGVTVIIKDGNTASAKTIVSGTTDSEGKVELTYPAKSSGNYYAYLEGLSEDYYTSNKGYTIFGAYQELADGVTISVFAYHVYTISVELDDGVDISKEGLEVLVSAGAYGTIGTATTDASGVATIRTESVNAWGATVTITNLTEGYTASASLAKDEYSCMITINAASSGKKDDTPSMTLGKAYTVEISKDANDNNIAQTVKFTSEAGGTYTITLVDNNENGGATVYTKEAYDKYGYPIMYNLGEDGVVLTYSFTLGAGESIKFVCDTMDYDFTTTFDFTLTVSEGGSSATPVTKLSEGANLVEGTYMGNSLSFTATDAGTYKFSSEHENFCILDSNYDTIADPNSPYTVELSAGQTITLTFSIMDNSVVQSEIYTVNVEVVNGAK